MKKILILAYDFPPYNSVGAQRPFSWYKYMHEFGYQPVVVTRHWNDDITSEVDYIKPSLKQSIERIDNNCGILIRVPFNPNFRDRFLIKNGLQKFAFLRKALSLFHIYKQYLFNEKVYYDIYKEAENYIRHNKIDVILASGEPYVLFKYANRLSAKYNIPWVADYRDNWSNDHYVPTVLKKFYEILERYYLKNVSLITTAAPSSKDALNELFPEKRMEVIFNGFFEEKFTEAADIPQESKVFTISYAGWIYPYQRLEVFLEGVKLFIEETNQPKLNINFFGIEFFPGQKQRILQFDPNLNEFITITDRISHDEVIKQMAPSHLLLVLADNKTIAVATKIFDYLALKRKILLVIDDEAILSKILSETNAGIKCRNAEDVKEALLKSYAEFEEKGMIQSQTSNFEQYSRKNQAKKMIEVIESIVK